MRGFVGERIVCRAKSRELGQFATARERQAIVVLIAIPGLFETLVDLLGHTAGDADLGVLGGDAVRLSLLLVSFLHADVGDDATAGASAGLADGVDVRASGRTNDCPEPESSGS